MVGWDKMWINIYVGVDFSFKYIIYKFKLKPLIHVQISYNDDEILQLKKTFPSHQVCMMIMSLIITVRNIARGTTDPWVDTITGGTL